MQIQYLKLEDFPNLINEQLYEEEFQLKYPTIKYEKVGDVNSEYGENVGILLFQVTQSGIHQFSKYRTIYGEKVVIHNIVIFDEEPSRDETFMKNRKKLIDKIELAKFMINEFKSNPIVIDPKTFEKFDKNSEKYRQYIQNMKDNCARAESELIEMEKQIGEDHLTYLKLTYL